jgi:DNA-binding MarR family transcriptional regulator
MSELPKPSLDHSLLGRQLSTATILFHSAVADRLGLNPTDHKCMGILAETGPIAAGELADMTGLTTGAITGVIDRLEQAGFVRRERDPNDRRRIIIQPLIEKAEREIGPLFQSLGQAMDALAAQYTEQELAVIGDFLKRAIAILHEETAKLRAGVTER